jgi:uncharacterized protein involved in exopolysaccharide biosynthesis
VSKKDASAAVVRVMPAPVSERLREPRRGAHEWLRDHHDGPAPRLTVARSLQRHWFVALLPVVVLAGVAVAAAFLRTPTYEAESRLVTGNPDVSDNLAAISGFDTVTQSLAERYARSISADDVVDPVAERMDIPPSAVRSRLSAASIPGTSVIRVDATGDSPARTVSLSVAASEALADWSNDTSQDQTLLTEYREAQLAISEATEEVEEQESIGDQVAVDEANAALAEAKLRAQQLEQGYLTTSGTPGGISELRVLERAHEASSDRGEKLQLMLFVAIVVGGAVGVACAVLRARRTVRRLLA